MISIDNIYEDLIVINKSKFYSFAYPITNEAQAKEYLNNLKDRFSDATHVCSAYSLSSPRIEKADDNGEPSGTAGKPILELIKKRNLDNVLVAVVRYFGGIKLGAGGLVMAYSKSVMEAIGEAEILEIEEYDVYEIVFEYSDIKTTDSEVRNNSLDVINKEYSDKVSYEIVSKDNRDILKIFEKYSGKISVNFKNKQFLEK